MIRASNDSRIVLAPRDRVREGDAPRLSYTLATDSRIVLAPHDRPYEVSPGHVLSRHNIFDPPLWIGNRKFSSIDQMYYSCYLAQHGMFMETD